MELATGLVPFRDFDSIALSRSDHPSKDRPIQEGQQYHEKQPSTRQAVKKKSACRLKHGKVYRWATSVVLYRKEGELSVNPKTRKLSNGIGGGLFPPIPHHADKQLTTKKKLIINKKTNSIKTEVRQRWRVEPDCKSGAFGLVGSNPTTSTKTIGQQY